MTSKTPVRVVFDGSNNATGLAEFQTGEFIPLSAGGLGASLSLGTAGQVLKVNSGATAVEFSSDSGIGLTNLSVGSEASASGNGALAYNNTTGVFTYTPPTLSGIGGDTDDVSEGSTNLYFTDARARSAISVTGSGSYDSGTGVITVTGGVTSVNTATGAVTLDTDDISEGSTNQYFTTARTRGAISVTDSGGDGSLGYNSSTGVITYTGPSASEVRAHISGGTGVTITDGEIAIGQDVGTSDNVQFNNATIDGNLTVNGTTTTVSSTNTLITDKLVELANGQTGTPSGDIGHVFERGDSDNAFIGFDESEDKFIVGTGTFTGASTGNLTITKGTLLANVEGNVTGNVTGNADTATTLETARTIAGQSFDGSANITIGLTDIGISDGSADQVLTTDGAGNFTFQDSQGGSGFSASTITVLPSSEGDFDLTKTNNQGASETPFDDAATDAFGVAVGSLFDMMEPTGSGGTTTDLGVFT